MTKLKQAEKRCVFEFAPGDSKWHIPLEPIAEHRAKHIADEYEGEVQTAVYKNELRKGLEDTGLLSDWLRNGKVPWDCVQPFAVKVEDTFGIAAQWYDECIEGNVWLEEIWK